MTLIDRSAFRQRLRPGDPLFVPYCPDALTARLCEQLGFDAGYLGGGGIGNLLAISEALVTVNEMAESAARIRRRSALPMVVDGGVGFGDAVHVTRTVWDLEAAGAHAIELEDQVAPKRVSHHRHIEHLIPAEEMSAKVRVAVQSRQDPDLLIIARTGAVQCEDFETAMSRGNAYLEAGADAIMLLTQTEEQTVQAPQRINGPVVIRKVFDVHTRAEWAELGYAMVIDAVTGAAVSFTALREAYERQRAERPVGSDPAGRYRAFEKFQDLGGFEELYEIERQTTEPGT